MSYDDGIARLQAFVERWPVGTHMTTRGLQVGAGIADLTAAEGAAAALRAQGLLEMETVGATHLWRRCVQGSSSASASSQAVLGTTRR